MANFKKTKKESRYYSKPCGRCKKPLEMDNHICSPKEVSKQDKTSKFHSLRKKIIIDNWKKLCKHKWDKGSCPEHGKYHTGRCIWTCEKCETEMFPLTGDIVKD